MLYHNEVPSILRLCENSALKTSYGWTLSKSSYKCLSHDPLAYITCKASINSCNVMWNEIVSRSYFD